MPLAGPGSQVISHIQTWFGSVMGWNGPWTWTFSSSAMVLHAIFFQHSVEWRLGSYVYAAISQTWNNLTWWQTFEFNLICSFYNGLSFLYAQLVYRYRAFGMFSLVFYGWSFTSPTLQGTLSNSKFLTSRCFAGPCVNSFFDQHYGSLAIWGADQSSSGSPQIAWAFFLSTKSAAVSASAASFRLSSL